ncbi:MAG: hypothetical protein H0T89_30525 [Deltaproteobacteria bacterium]|nr:hypothetical protein [Deltaproteobacteria bacterium]MDQ3300018.1 hypothetical protein [Myxococcota bacterium]
MTTARFTYQRLVELVEGDHDLIERLVEVGIIECRDDDRALVDLDRVLVARTLWRDLDIEWPGIEVILRLCSELAEARLRIVELEAELATRED